MDARSLPADGDLTRRHRLIAVVIGVVFGFVFGLTSVGAGAFFGMALILLFPPRHGASSAPTSTTAPW